MPVDADGVATAEIRLRLGAASGSWSQRRRGGGIPKRQVLMQELGGGGDEAGKAPWAQQTEPCEPFPSVKSSPETEEAPSEEAQSQVRVRKEGRNASASPLPSRDMEARRRGSSCAHSGDREPGDRQSGRWFGRYKTRKSNTLLGCIWRIAQLRLRGQGSAPDPARERK